MFSFCKRQKRYAKKRPRTSGEAACCNEMISAVRYRRDLFPFSTPTTDTPTADAEIRAPVRSRMEEHAAEAVIICLSFIMLFRLPWAEVQSVRSRTCMLLYALTEGLSILKSRLFLIFTHVNFKLFCVCFLTKRLCPAGRLHRTAGPCPLQDRQSKRVRARHFLGEWLLKVIP